MSSVPALAPDPEPSTPVPVSDIDKMLIQDKLNERGRVRDALTDTFRYLVIGVIAFISYFVGTNYSALKNMSVPDLGILLYVILMLVAVAAWRTHHLRRRLETLNAELNTGSHTV